MNHELISVTSWPTMPTPMKSSDPGEAWAWGDFFLTLQKDPPIMGQSMQQVAGEKVTMPSAMEYPYAMVVFYHLSKNPHGPSIRPVLCAGLEQPNYGAIADHLAPADSPFFKKEGKGPIMVGAFSARSHFNMGEFNGPLTADSARQRLLGVVASQLGLTGEPEYIGTINDIYGHPLTGWPVEGKTPLVSKSKKQPTCQSLILTAVITVVVILLIVITLFYWSLN